MKKILMLIVLIGSASQILTVGHGHVCCPHSKNLFSFWNPYCNWGLYCRPNCNQPDSDCKDGTWHCAYHPDVCWYPPKYN
ncbi:MAG: hypothetical protein A3E88_07895 [Legionellales bacterium RIFCSPHIGHO2_12_FULL_35_11]|nr:MAG: hypothetical protein A3E88_07895 [Legionellales bacterium RIFCSPHIGHO2_12_FULL_35_11]